jgi:hypothetical protein
MSNGSKGCRAGLTGFRRPFEEACRPVQSMDRTGEGSDRVRIARCEGCGNTVWGQGPIESWPEQVKVFVLLSARAVSTCHRAAWGCKVYGLAGAEKSQMGSAPVSFLKPSIVTRITRWAYALPLAQAATI